MKRIRDSADPRPSHLATPRARRRARGQSLVELALVAPVLLLLFGGAVQLGVIFAAKSTLVQVARDTARWASTQQVTPCEAAATAAPAEPVTQADSIASNSGMIGYAAGMWGGSNFTVYPGPTPSIPPAPPADEGVEVAWSYPTSGACPPADNATTASVTVRTAHRVPVFLPGIWLLPGGSCGGSGCSYSVSSKAVFRMEPQP